MSTFVSIPIRENGKKIEAGWFNALRSAGVDSASASGQWTKYTFTHTQLQAAALTNTVEIASLPAKTIIESVLVKHSTLFTGTSITDYKVTVGITGELDRYVGSVDVDVAVSDSAFAFVNLAEMPSFSSATSLKLTATSVGANLSSSIAGSVDVWVKTSTLP